MPIPNRYEPEHWSTMLQGITDWANQNANGIPVIWEKQALPGGTGVPAPQRPFIALGKVAGPVGFGQAEVRNFGVSVRIISVAAGTYTITIGGVACSFVAGANDTAITIRDGLIAAIISHALLGPYALMADVLTLGTQRGVLPTLAVTSNLSLCVAVEYIKDSVATFSVDVFAAPNQGAITPDAISILSRLKLSFETAEVTQQLQTAGWAFVSIVGDRKPDQVMGSRWEDRAGFDVRLRCASRLIHVNDYIDSFPITSVQGSFSA